MVLAALGVVGFMGFMGFMDISYYAGLAEVAGIGRGGLSRAGTAEHTLEHGEAVVVRDDLLQTDGGDVELRAGGRHVGIALVGTYYNIARLGNAEVASRHAGVGGEELVAQA